MESSKKQTGTAPELDERQASSIEPQAKSDAEQEQGESPEPEAGSLKPLSARAPGTTRILPCVLTQDELLEKARELVKAQQELQRIESDKKIEMKNFAARIERATVRRDALMSVVAEGKELRRVEVEHVMNTPEPGKKTTYRKDTGELVGVEIMYADDFEQPLPGIGDSIEDFPEESEEEEELDGPQAPGVEPEQLQASSIEPQANTEGFAEGETAVNARSLEPDARSLNTPEAGSSELEKDEARGNALAEALSDDEDGEGADAY